MPPITRRTILHALGIVGVIVAISVGITAAAQGLTRAPLDWFAIAISAGIPFLTGLPTTLWILGLHERLRRANSELAEANRRLHHLASTDTLTGMRTRSAFFEAMDMSRELYSVGVLLMVDADHFKPINDRYGHLSGDIVLKEIAEAIRNSLRNGDIAGRLGGEEFAVYLPDTDPEAARAVAETIRRSVAALDLRSLGNDEIGVTVSIGIAPTRDRSRSQLLAAADRQLYRAKDEGRDRCSSE